MDDTKIIPIPKINLHNHTTFSDGEWSAFEIITKAVESGLDAIGISDHLYTLKTTSLFIDNLSAYMEHIQDLKNQFKGRIKLFSGIEIDSCPERNTLLFDLPFDELSRLDFVLFEYVGDKYWRGIPFEDFLEIRKKLKTQVGLAHWNSRDILENIDASTLANSIKENEIFLEITSFRRYNFEGVSYFELEKSFFKLLAKLGVKFTVGSDTHDDLDEVADIEKEINFLDEIKAKILFFDDGK